MMSLLLCHECFHWVTPDRARCTACGRAISVHTPDPPVEVLSAAIGDLLFPLGALRAKSSQSPSRGALFAATNGLLFLPAWSEPGELVCETRIRRRDRATPEQVVDRALHDADSHVGRAGLLLLNNPGSFFVPRGQIRSLRLRARTLSIERQDRSRVTLSIDGAHAPWRAAIARLTAQPAWRDIANRRPAWNWKPWPVAWFFPTPQLSDPV